MKTRAADDYDFIRDRLRELKAAKMDFSSYIPADKTSLSDEVRKTIAQAYDCAYLYSDGKCQFLSSYKCIFDRKCQSKAMQST
jgi:hypothetical protein